MHPKIRKGLHSAVNWTAIIVIAVLAVPMELLSVTVTAVEKSADALSGWLENERNN